MQEQYIQKALSITEALDGHKCDFGPKDIAFLKQFGIRHVTGIRNSSEGNLNKNSPAIDRELAQIGFFGAVNSCSLQDFVIEKDGLQMLVSIEWGAWSVGRHVLCIETGELYFVSAISRQTRKELKYGLWLTDKETFAKEYARKDESARIDAYPVSNVVFSDLGPDGKLFV